MVFDLKSSKCTYRTKNLAFKKYLYLKHVIYDNKPFSYGSAKFQRKIPTDGQVELRIQLIFNNLYIQIIPAGEFLGVLFYVFSLEGIHAIRVSA